MAERTPGPAPAPGLAATPASAPAGPAPAAPAVAAPRPAPPAVRLGGAPLPAAVRAPIERGLGADMGAVRLHSGPGAARAAADLGARAFAYGPNIYLGAGARPDDLGLIAHEAAHVVQQQAAPAVLRLAPGQDDAYEREATRAAEAVVRGERFSVRERTAGPRAQGLGIGDALDFFADRANLIPGFRMFTILLGVNPINMSRVARSAANILRALIEFIPGGGLITQALDSYGIFERVGAWVEEQLRTLGLSGASIREAISRFLDSLSWRDIFNLSGVWERAKRIVTEPIGRVISFAGGLVSGVLRFVKEAILRPLARLAEGTRGYDLLKAVLGEDPITGEPAPRNAETLIGGFMKLIGQEEVWDNLRRSNAVGRAWTWFQGALSGLLAFVRQIPGRFVAALRSLELADVVLVPRAFARVAGAFAGLIGRFLSWAGEQVLGLLQIIFEVVAPAAVPYLRRAAGAFRSILRNPVGFIGNLVRAGIQGFRQFARNFLGHLRTSLVSWLTGALSGGGIYIPQAFSLVEIIKFVLSVLGLTWQNLRQKLVRAIGEPAVRALEAGLDLVITLVREGPAAAWQKIVESIGNLQQLVIEQIMNFVRDRVVQAAITRLLTSLNPAGAFIQAILAIYNTVMFFVERLRQIAQVAASVIDAIAAIAAGVIGPAADRVERTMAGLLTLVISFLARIAGLGRVSDAVLGIIARVRAPIDRALDRVADWIRQRGQALLARAAGGTPQQRLASALRAGQAAANRFAGRRVGGAILGPLLAAIRVRFQLRSLEAVARGNRWAVRGAVNPEGETPTDAQVEGAGGGAGGGEATSGDAVKQRVRGELQRRPKELGSADEAESMLRAIFSQYRPQGLRSLRVLPGDPGTAAIVASASADLTIARIRFAFKASGPKKVIVFLRINEFWSPGEVGHQNIGGGLHAEEILKEHFPNHLERYRSEYPTLPPRKVEIFVKYSPCMEVDHYCAIKLVDLRRQYPDIPQWSVFYNELYGERSRSRIDRSVEGLQRLQADEFVIMGFELAVRVGRIRMAE